MDSSKYLYDTENLQNLNLRGKIQPYEVPKY